MKILQVISTFYPALAFGGAVRVAYDISKEMAKRGHEVEVYTTNAFDQSRNFRPSSKEQVMNGFKVTYFDNIVRPSNIFFSPEMLEALRKNLGKFDIIHTHFGRQPYDNLIEYYAQKYDYPYVLHAHGCLSHLTGRRSLKQMYDILFGRRILRKASAVIALNQLEALQYRNMGVSNEKIIIIPNGIDLSEYSHLPTKGSFKKKYGIREDAKIVLYLGRVHRTKGIDLLIRAHASIVNSTKQNIVLIIAGPDDGYSDEGKSLAASLGISNLVTFTGFISNDVKVDALVDAEVFVTPSFQGFPMTFLEACAVGLPIVTTTLGDVLEWIDGNVGHATAPTYYDLAKAIGDIISDDKLHNHLSKNCVETVRSNFSIEKTVDSLERIYRDVI